MKVLTPIILLIASFGLLYLFVKPHYENLNILREQSSQFDDAISRAELVGVKRNDLLNRRNNFSLDDMNRLQKFLPDSVDNIRLIVDVSNLAAHYGSSLKNIGIAVSNIQDPSTIGTDTRPYGTLFMNFGVSMSYDQFKKFMGDLERSLRLIDISAVTFKPSDLSPTYDFSVNLSTYWLK